MLREHLKVRAPWAPAQQPTLADSLDNRHTIRYLSLNSTRDTLGVDPAVRGAYLTRRSKIVYTRIGLFESCSGSAGRDFRQSYDFFRGSYDYIAALLERGVRVLVYNGDYDFIVNWPGTERC